MDFFILNGGSVRTYMYNLDYLSQDPGDQAKHDWLLDLQDNLNSITDLLKSDKSKTQSILVQLSYKFITKKRFMRLLGAINDDMDVYRSLVNFLSGVAGPLEESLADQPNDRARLECLSRTMVGLLLDTEAVHTFMTTTVELLTDFEKEALHEDDVEAICSLLSLFTRLAQLAAKHDTRKTLNQVLCTYKDVHLDNLLEKLVTCPSKGSFSEGVILLLQALFEQEKSLLAEMREEEEEEESDEEEVTVEEESRSCEISPGEGGGEDTVMDRTASNAADASFALYKTASGFVPRGYCELADTMLRTMRQPDQARGGATLDAYFWLHKTFARFCLDEPPLSIRTLLKSGTFSPMFHCYADVKAYMTEVRLAESDGPVPIPDRLLDGLFAVTELVHVIYRMRSKKTIQYSMFCDLRANLFHNNDLVELLLVVLRAHELVTWPQMVLRSVLVTCARLHDLLEDDDTYSIMSFSMMFLQRKLMLVYADVLATYADNAPLLNNFIVHLLSDTLKSCGTLRLLFVPELIAVFTELKTMNISPTLQSVVTETLVYYSFLSQAYPEDLHDLLYGGVADEDRLINNERLLYLSNFFLKHDKAKRGRRDLPLNEILVSMARVNFFYPSEVVLANLFKMDLIEAKTLIRERQKVSKAESALSADQVASEAAAVEACVRVGLVGYLTWLQIQLLDIRNTKAQFLRGDLNMAARKPLFFHYIRFGLSVPLPDHGPVVIAIMTNVHMRRLFSHLGLEVRDQPGQDSQDEVNVFVPVHWSPDTLLKKAVSLGNYVLDLVPELEEMGEERTAEGDELLTNDLITQIDSLDEKDLFATAEATEPLMSLDWDKIIKAANVSLPSPNDDSGPSAGESSPDGKSHQ